MTLDEFKASLPQSQPPESVPAALQALWHEANGRWHSAHEIVQQSEERSAEWVHAYLHRREGDLSNAAYWYRRVGRSAPQMSLEEEWECIAELLLPQCKP